MAQSRLEKIGTVYTRITSLLRGKALKEEDRPIWLAVYAAFPPKYEPRYGRQMPAKPIKSIFYKEDLIRAKFHQDQSFLPATNLGKDDRRSATQEFLSMYKMIQKEGLPDDSAYEQAIQQYTSKLEISKVWKKVENKFMDNFK